MYKKTKLHEVRKREKVKRKGGEKEKVKMSEFA